MVKTLLYENTDIIHVNVFCKTEVAHFCMISVYWYTQLSQSFDEVHLQAALPGEIMKKMVIFASKQKHF